MRPARFFHPSFPGAQTVRKSSSWQSVSRVVFCPRPPHRTNGKYRCFPSGAPHHIRPIPNRQCNARVLRPAIPALCGGCVRWCRCRCPAAINPGPGNNGNPVRLLCCASRTWCRRPGCNAWYPGTRCHRFHKFRFDGALRIQWRF